LISSSGKLVSPSNTDITLTFYPPGEMNIEYKLDVGYGLQSLDNSSSVSVNLISPTEHVIHSVVTDLQNGQVTFYML